MPSTKLATLVGKLREPRRKVDHIHLVKRLKAAYPTSKLAYVVETPNHTKAQVYLISREQIPTLLKAETPGLIQKVYDHPFWLTGEFPPDYGKTMTEVMQRRNLIHSLKPTKRIS